MAGLFLFTSPSPAPSPGGEHPKDMGGGGDDDFAISAAGWAGLQQLVAQTLDARPAADALLTPGACASASLQLAWSTLATQAQGWSGSVAPALGMAAVSLIGYARDTVPRLYGEVKARVAGPADPAAALACSQALGELADEAQARRTQTQGLAEEIAPFASAARDLASAFDALERNPAVRIVLPDIPYLCLAYDGSGVACAGDVRQDDGRQHWTVSFDADGGGCRLLNGGQMLAIDNPASAFPSPFGMLMPSPPPKMVAAGAADGRSRFHVPDPAGKGYIKADNWPNHVLDCAGNDGWAAGTPVLNFVANDGSNQHWGFSPPYRPQREVAFHDAVAGPADAAGSTEGLERLEGAWMAVADDLHKGVQAALTSAQDHASTPFIAAIEVQAAIDAWAKLADIVEAASAGFRPVSPS